MTGPQRRGMGVIINKRRGLRYYYYSAFINAWVVLLFV